MMQQSRTRSDVVWEGLQAGGSYLSPEFDFFSCFLLNLIVWLVFVDLSRSCPLGARQTVSDNQYCRVVAVVAFQGHVLYKHHFDTSFISHAHARAEIMRHFKDKRLTTTIVGSLRSIIVANTSNHIRHPAPPFTAPSTGSSKHWACRHSFSLGVLSHLQTGQPPHETPCKPKTPMSASEET